MFLVCSGFSAGLLLTMYVLMLADCMLILSRHGFVHTSKLKSSDDESLVSHRRVSLWSSCNDCNLMNQTEHAHSVGLVQSLLLQLTSSASV